MMSKTGRNAYWSLFCCWWLLLPSFLRTRVGGFIPGGLKRSLGPVTWSNRFETTGATCSGPLLARVRRAPSDEPITSGRDLQAHTVKDLRNYLKARGLKQGGVKAELIKALAESLGVPLEPPEEEISDKETLPPRRTRKTKPKTEWKPPLREPAPTQTVNEQFRAELPSTIDSPVDELASELMLDAELAENGEQNTAGVPLLDEEDVESDESEEDDYSASSSWGNECADPERQGQLPEGFNRVPQPAPKRQANMPRRPEPTEDMRRRMVIEDLMERRHMNFDLEEAFYPETYTKSGVIPQGNMYAVYTKKAVRPWEGPHAHRAETHMVVLLSDVYGWEDPYTRSIADQVAEICDAIVLVPDLFRGRPREKVEDEEEGERGEEYEAWRASHHPAAVSSDVRACVAHARAEFKPTSLALMGFCYGGGKALEEAAAGVVKPDDVVVFYPTQYSIEEVAPNIECPVAAFFAESDVLPGATPDDARALREGFLKHNKVRDFQIKLCPGAHHGFVHRPMRRDKQNSEDAMLLATSWLDIYLHKAFPAKGGEVKNESGFGFWQLPAKDEKVNSSPVSC